MTTLVDTSELYRLSLDEYHRLIDAGGFEGEARLEPDGYGEVVVVERDGVLDADLIGLEPIPLAYVLGAPGSRGR